MAERTLRERCIEAGAYSFPSDWLTDDHHIQIGERAFDAILGVLTEHADEWMGEVAGPEPIAGMTMPHWNFMLGLLAVLGGDGGGVR